MSRIISNENILSVSNVSINKSHYQSNNWKLTKIYNIVKRLVSFTNSQQEARKASNCHHLLEDKFRFGKRM